MISRFLLLGTLLGSMHATHALDALQLAANDASASKSESIKGGNWGSPDANTEKADDAPVKAKGKTAASQSSPRKNRLSYVAFQSALSTYIYGSAIPLAFDVQSTRVHVAMPLIVAPIAFGSHFYFSKANTFEDAHLLGTSYVSIAAMYTTHALALATISDSKTAYQTASIAALGLYPLSIWGGYELGNQYIDLPGRIETQYKFALGFGLLGLLTPLLYFENNSGHGDLIWRLGLGQSVALAGLGHIVSSQYRVGENVPAGVSTGILQHSILGSIAGIEVAALANAGASVRPWLGSALLGGTLGFTEGLFYYHDKYDSKERSFYNGLGALGGGLMGAGICILFYDSQASDYSQKILISSLVGGGTWIGYWATNFLTRGMEERTSQKASEEKFHWSFQPLPFPEAKMAHDKLYLQYHMQGLTVTF